MPLKLRLRSGTLTNVLARPSTPVAQNTFSPPSPSSCASSKSRSTSSSDSSSSSSLGAQQIAMQRPAMRQRTFRTRATGRFLPRHIKDMIRGRKVPGLTDTTRTPVAALYTDLASSTPTQFPSIANILMASATKATWRARNNAMHALLQRGLLDDPLRAIETLLSQRQTAVTDATIVKDISQCKWSVRRLLPSSEAEPMLALLDDLQKGVRIRSARVPKKKALPMSKEVLRAWLPRLPFHLQALALLAFRSASRVGEVLELTRENCTTPTKSTDLLVSFQVSKTNREGTKRSDHRLMIQQPEPTITRYIESVTAGPLWLPEDKTALKSALRNLRPPPGEVRRWQEMAPEDKVRSSYGFHSFKRGAAALAWDALAANQISTTDLQLLLKHKDITSSLGYCPRPAAAALATGSRATLTTRIGSFTTRETL